MNFGRTYLRILALHNAIFEVIAFVSSPARWLSSSRRAGLERSVRHARRVSLTAGRLEPDRR